MPLKDVRDACLSLAAALKASYIMQPLLVFDVVCRTSYHIGIFKRALCLELFLRSSCIQDSSGTFQVVKL